MPARNWLGWYCRQWQWLILSSALKRHWKFALASTLKPFFFVGKQVAKQILWKTVIWWYDTTARSRTKREWWYANHSKKIQVDGKNRRKPVLEQNKQFSRYATVFFLFLFFRPVNLFVFFGNFVFIQWFCQLLLPRVGMGHILSTSFWKSWSFLRGFAVSVRELKLFNSVCFVPGPSREQVKLFLSIATYTQGSFLEYSQLDDYLRKHNYDKFSNREHPSVLSSRQRLKFTSKCFKVTQRWKRKDRRGLVGSSF